MLIGIEHDMADTMSIADSGRTYSDRDSYEIAFFSKGEWVTESLPEFAQWGSLDTPEQRIYTYVPRDIVGKFLGEHTMVIPLNRRPW
tara:strand:- start:3070 stop:3330 length:261 start_codon:yes stop_codon:yes gene_type:complete